jgi:PiT family inorganic phosphate transporter
MSINSLIRWLKPREMVFFDLLEASTSNLMDASKCFTSAIVSGDPVDLARMRKEIKEFEHKGDEITHQILDHLDRTFVTPLEREDLFALAHALDDVADCMDAAAERMVLYKIQHVLPIAKDMSNLIVQGTDLLHPLVQGLRTMSNIKGMREIILEVTSLENQSDALFHAALAELFEDPKDPIYLIKWKEILSQLEEAVDRVELVARTMHPSIPLVLGLIILMSWAIDYINGFHDTANSIATVVSTGVLSARNAIMMSAVLNFAGAMAGTQVATTIAKGIADSQFVVPQVIIAALAAAIIWDIATWYFGIPSSTSHTLMGGLAGAVAAHAGWGALKWAKLREIGAFIIISPLLGFIVGMFLILLILRICRHFSGHKVNGVFRKLQLVSAGAMAFTHGSNDAQKAMGIICLSLIIYGKLHVVGAKVDVPLWVKLSSASMMALGTAAGGWRIIKTLGTKIVKLRPIHGFAAETAAAIVLFTTAHLGIPVSTTHSISGAIMGVGASMNASLVRWGVAGNIFVAWVLTIPCSMAIAALTLKLINPLF